MGKQLGYTQLGRILVWKMCIWKYIFWFSGAFSDFLKVFLHHLGWEKQILKTIGQKWAFVDHLWFNINWYFGLKPARPDSLGNYFIHPMGWGWTNWKPKFSLPYFGDVSLNAKYKHRGCGKWVTHSLCQNIFWRYISEITIVKCFKYTHKGCGKWAPFIKSVTTSKIYAQNCQVGK